MSHEIRTPLNIVVVGLSLLRNELEGGIVDPNARDAVLKTVSEISESCDVAVTILGDLLTLDKLETDALRLDLEDICVISFLNETVRPFKVQVLVFCFRA